MKQSGRTCECGNPIRRDNTSGLCRACKPPRYVRRPLVINTCRGCESEFETTRSNKAWCSPECRPTRARRSTNQRGYGPAHQRARLKWQALVDTGTVTCCLCDEKIQPSTDWHLDHTADRTGYRGAAHALCNLQEGQRRSAMTVLANHYGVDRQALATWLEAQGGGSSTGRASTTQTWDPLESTCRHASLSIL